ncbi:MAG: anaerobic ribonucleoside-triphosphate reductase activating protein [Lentisphaerae bacterium]|nr:anaerobic ribonucleoside-triphosphate reductase activating protein [Lentisphaerota bacterium]
MRFGLQKLTLLDYPGVVACTVFCCGCNFRCPFCHNGFLVLGNEAGLELDFASMLEFLEKRRGILEGVCFTGGEFLMHADAIDAVSAAKALGYKVKVDTNGSFPEALAELIDSGSADYIAMDIKNSPQKYAATCGRNDVLEKVKASVELLKHGNVEFEFRTTVTGSLHELADFEDIGKWICGAEKYFLQPFVESEDILDKSGDFKVSGKFVDDALRVVQRYVPAAAIRGK